VARLFERAEESALLHRMTWVGCLESLTDLTLLEVTGEGTVVLPSTVPTKPILVRFWAGLRAFREVDLRLASLALWSRGDRAVVGPMA